MAGHLLRCFTVAFSADGKKIVSLRPRVCSPDRFSSSLLGNAPQRNAGQLLFRSNLAHLGLPNFLLEKLRFTTKLETVRNFFLTIFALL